LNATAASALSITIKSLSQRLRPDAEKFAASGSCSLIRPASSNLNPLALCYLDLDASPMPTRPVAVDHGASLCPVTSLIIGVVAEPSDEGAGIGLDGRAASFRDRSQANRFKWLVSPPDWRNHPVLFANLASRATLFRGGQPLAGIDCARVFGVDSER
jgi:hypothetical protein